ncbi:hypothetical protein JZO79_11655 [Vagococcus fluvialis]|uniref:hypothetical protein n=1 Tax=Vagococcus fluvialis TaxID=2738 RepID=UPI001A8D665E|nr:hypothetical protein [Vagococcus fluvialis]MBO0444268.1 hypothetical protein [Vagococcus fluvialis]
MKDYMLKIVLKKYVDESNIDLKFLSKESGIHLDIINQMYDVGEFDSRKVNVQGLAVICLILRIPTLDDLIPGFN